MTRHDPPTDMRPARLFIQLHRFVRDQTGATALEYLLVLGAIAIPSYFIIKMALAMLVDYYRMMATINALPFP